MCEACNVDAVVVLSEVVPGYALMRAQREGSEHWPLDWYGLVRMNNPIAVFPGPLLRDPDAVPERFVDADPNAVEALADAFVDAGKGLQKRLQLSVDDGYALGAACVKAGYQPNGNDGYIAFWLLERMARLTEQQNQKARQAMTSRPRP